MILWLASYPRSGNTFLRTLLFHRFGVETYSRYNDKLDISKSSSLAETVGHRNFTGSWDEFYKSALDAEPLIAVKTHGPPPDGEKAIYVIRDAPAAIVSFYHYLNAYSRYKADIYDVISGAVSYGCWSRHYESWSPQTRPDTLFLKFEELTGDIDAAVQKIAAFTGLSIKTGKLPEFSVLQKKFPQFFRTGSDDRNKAELSEDQLSYLNFLHGEARKALGYVDDYRFDIQSVRRAMERQAEKLLNFRLGEIATLTNNMYDVKHIVSTIREIQEADRELIRRADYNARRLAQRLAERDKYVEIIEDKLRRKDAKISEQAAIIERLKEKAQLVDALKARADALKARNGHLEYVLAPRLKSLIEFRALRHILAERRKAKAASAPEKASK